MKWRFNILLLSFISFYLLPHSVQGQSEAMSAYAVAWHPNGLWRAVAITFANGNAIQVIDETGETVLRFDLPSEPIDVGWSQDGDWLGTTLHNMIGADSSIGTDIYLWNVQDEQSTVIDGLEATDCNNNIYWSPVADQFAVVESSIFRIYEPLRGEILQTPVVADFGSDCVVGMAWSPDAITIYGAMEGGRIVRWNTQTNSSEALYQLEQFLWSMILSPDGDQLIINDVVGQLSIFDLQTSRVTQRLEVPNIGDRRLTYLTWSPNQNLLIGANYDGAVVVWDMNTYQLIDQQQTNSIPTGSVQGISLSPTGGQLSMAWLQSQYNILPPVQQGILYRREALEGSIQTIVPAPSEARLAAITNLCNLPARTEAALDQQAATDLTAFTTQVEALPDTQIAPGCRADLLAVAQALQAQ